MKLIRKRFLLGSIAALGLVSSASFAGGNIVTRSIEDINADLMRTYRTHGGQPAGMVTTRSAADANADLVRDWNAKPSGTNGKGVQARSVDDAHADLMRYWGPVATAK
ncbi:MAG TPA: hypothetical protein VFB20_00640 [Burkholderiales bacterium]|nr:hypothetical protein [Burkholderiales bacterium]